MNHRTCSLLRMKLVNSNSEVQITGQESLASKSNYFFGNDPSQWHKNIPNYSRIGYQQIYPGIDLSFYGNQRQLEYDFIVSPGANYKAIQFQFQGTKRIHEDADGNLVLETSAGDVTQRKPLIYQMENGIRHEVSGSFVIGKNQMVGFELTEAYNSALPLIIDPVLTYSTYLGGKTGIDGITSVAVDPAGNAYVTGSTQSTDFPIVNGYTIINHGQADVFVSKFNPEGTALIFSTYLGGAFDDIPERIVLDASGNIYIAGNTLSANFLTVSAIQPSSKGLQEAFVTKMDPTGSTVFLSTYLGGSGNDAARSVAVDSAGNIYVVGSTDSLNFPTVNTLQSAIPNGPADAFITRINAGGLNFGFSTYFGGTNVDEAFEVVSDGGSNIYVTGRTASADFPTKNALQKTNGGGTPGTPFDVFVLKVNTSGPTLVYSTYLGGAGDDTGYGIALDSSGNVYLTGTTSSTNFPVSGNAFQKTLQSGATDGFVSKLNSTGSAIFYSSYLSGITGSEARDIAVDASGNALVTGATSSKNFPRIAAFQNSKTGGATDAFIMKVNPSGSDIVYASYLGGSGDDAAQGITVDGAGNAYVVGNTSSANFPTQTPFQSSLAGGASDGFIAKISDSTSSVLFVPVVLSSTGLNNSFFTSELTLTNRGSKTANVNLYYTASFEVTGSTNTTLGAGQQVVISDAITYLRGLGIPIPSSGNRGGTLMLRFTNLSSSSDAAATVRTATAVSNGRAGLAYAGISASAALKATSYLCGLRQNSNDRSNVAIQNAGGVNDGPLTLRLTVFSGSNSNFSQDLPDETLPVGGFKQISGILQSNGLNLDNGFVRIQRISGNAPYYAYAVVNDQANSDGSFIPPILESALDGKEGLTLPVIVETNAFNTELTIANWGFFGKILNLSFVSDSITTPNKTASISLTVSPGEQLIIPDFVQYMRTHGALGLGSPGPALAGAVFVTTSGNDMTGIFLGARTSTPGGGGRYGLFYTAVPYGSASTPSTWIYGLQQNAENRTNLALINTGEVEESSDTFTIDFFNGDTGTKASTVQIPALEAKRWRQYGTVLSQYAPGVGQGYARIQRTGGVNPFIVYSVINDGSQAGQRTGDGAFVTSAP
ncbi:MAG: SBBP repeat-containing protein [Terriglobia bacterium]